MSANTTHTLISNIKSHFIVTPLGEQTPRQAYQPQPRFYGSSASSNAMHIWCRAARVVFVIEMPCAVTHTHTLTLTPDTIRLLLRPPKHLFNQLFRFGCLTVRAKQTYLYGSSCEVFAFGCAWFAFGIYVLDHFYLSLWRSCRVVVEWCFVQIDVCFTAKRSAIGSGDRIFSIFLTLYRYQSRACSVHISRLSTYK